MNNNLNIKKISEIIAKKENLPERDIRRYVEDIVSFLSDSLIKGDSFEIRGFGTFKVKERKARWARDIHKNKEIFVPSHKSLTFIPALSLKRLLNKRI